VGRRRLNSCNWARREARRRLLEDAAKVLDFVVNGQPLWQKVGKPLDLVTVLALDEHVAPEKSGLAVTVRRLILKEPAELLGESPPALYLPRVRRHWLRRDYGINRKGQERNRVA